jgi:hypothetical protein
MKFSVFALCLLASEAFAQDYFPLHVGNQWIYRTSLGARSATLRVIDITGTETVDGKTYSVVRGFSDGPALLRQSEDGTLYNYNREAKTEEVWAVFSTKEGDTYRTDINPCSRTARVESRSGKVSVPAGDFMNALSIFYPAANCADAGLERDFFAPYIGLVERTSTTIAGPRQMQLVYARVGGVTVLAGPEVNFTVALDKTSYESGETAVVRLALRNTTPAPVTLQFTSGQRYEIQIRDAAGKVAYTWSATRTFIQAVGSEAISGGERNYAEPVSLTLPAGRYTLEAWLTNSPQPPRYAGTVGFDIR